jgi:hypothetical protein
VNILLWFHGEYTSWKISFFSSFAEVTPSFAGPRKSRSKLPQSLYRLQLQIPEIESKPSMQIQQLKANQPIQTPED